MRFVLFLLIAALSFACNDGYFDLAPQDKLSEVNFWQTEKDAFDALTGVYARLGEKGSIWNIWTRYTWGTSCMTDDARGPFGDFRNGSLNPTSGDVGELWRDFYTSIRTCNVFLDNIDKPVMDENLRIQYSSEARFLRAFFYSHLTNHWGGVPLLQSALDLDELSIPRSTAGEVQDFILDELEIAAKGLPMSYSDQDLGRATSGAALTLKARQHLYRGQFEAASETALQIMSMGYKLFQDENGEGYYSLAQPENEDNSEIIFAVRYQLPDHGYFFQTWIHPSEHVHEGWGGIQVFQSFVDAFECTDGKTIQESPLFDPQDEFVNRDPRLDMAVLRKGDMLSGAELTGPVVDNAAKYTGYYPRKLYFNNYVGWDRYDTDLVMMRYAEVLLIYAEARIELGQIDQSVLDALNRIRARAYNVDVADVHNYPAISTFDQNQLRTIVRRERHVELGLEYNDSRLNDLRRWKLAEVVLNGKAMGAKDDTGEYRFVEDLRFDASKHYLWPVPQEEIDLIGSDVITQNAGY